MTKKQINLMEKKTVNEIEKGTIVKKSGDMFIVAKISEAQFESVVDEALFSPRYHHVGTRHNGSAVTSRAVRNPSEAKYVLVSLTTGLKFYPEFLNLRTLLSRMANAGFEVVDSIEIREVHN